MTRASRTILTGASLGALILAAPVVSDRMTERALLRSLEAVGASGSVAVSSLSGTVTVSNLIVGDGATRIGSLRWQQAGGGLIGPAMAQAGGFTLENLVTTFEKGSIRIPKVTVEGASFGAGDWASIFAVDAGMPDRIRAMNASAIVVPEIAFAASVDAQNKFEYTLRDIRADGLVNGRFATVVAGRTEFLTTAPGMTQDGIGKRMEMTGVNLAQMAHVWFGTARPDEKPAALYDQYLIEGMTSTARGEIAMDMTFGKVVGRSLRVRPLKDRSLAAAFADLMKQSDAARAQGTKPDDKEMLGRILPMMSDLIDGFEDEGTSGDGMTVAAKQENGDTALISIGRFAGSYGGGSVPAGFLLSDMAVKTNDVTARLAHFGVAGFSYAPTLKAMADLTAKGITDFSSVDPRRFMPKFGEITIKGFSIDMADPNTPAGVKPERINVRLGQFLLSAKNEIQGIPTDITLGIDNLAFNLPEHSSEPGFQTIRALGYTAIDLSAKVAAAWNEQAREVSIGSVSVSGADMGSVRMTGRLGNIGREVFEAEPALVQVALMGATAKAVSLKVENNGLAEKLIAMQARQQGRKPEDVRKEMGTLAALGIPALLGPSDDAKAISGAIARFLARPRNLSIDIAAKNAGGIGIPDLAMIGNPQAAMGLVTVKAAASD